MKELIAHEVELALMQLKTHHIPPTRHLFTLINVGIKSFNDDSEFLDTIKENLNELLIRTFEKKISPLPDYYHPLLLTSFLGPRNEEILSILYEDIFIGKTTSVLAHFLYAITKTNENITQEQPVTQLLHELFSPYNHSTPICLDGVVQRICDSDLIPAIGETAKGIYQLIEQLFDFMNAHSSGLSFTENDKIILARRVGEDRKEERVLQQQLVKLVKKREQERVVLLHLNSIKTLAALANSPDIIAWLGTQEEPNQNRIANSLIAARNVLKKHVNFLDADEKNRIITQLNIAIDKIPIQLDNKTIPTGEIERIAKEYGRLNELIAIIHLGDESFQQSLVDRLEVHFEATRFFDIALTLTEDDIEHPNFDMETKEKSNFEKYMKMMRIIALKKDLIKACGNQEASDSKKSLSKIFDEDKESETRYLPIELQEQTFLCLKRMLLPSLSDNCVQTPDHEQVAASDLEKLHVAKHFIRSVLAKACPGLSGESLEIAKKFNQATFPSDQGGLLLPSLREAMFILLNVRVNDFCAGIVESKDSDENSSFEKQSIIKYFQKQLQFFLSTSPLLIPESQSRYFYLDIDEKIKSMITANNNFQTTALLFKGFFDEEERRTAFKEQLPKSFATLTQVLIIQQHIDISKKEKLTVENMDKLDQFEFMLALYNEDLIHQDTVNHFLEFIKSNDEAYSFLLGLLKKYLISKQKSRNNDHISTSHPEFLINKEFMTLLKNISTDEWGQALDKIDRFPLSKRQPITLLHHLSYLGHYYPKIQNVSFPLYLFLIETECFYRKPENKALLNMQPDQLRELFKRLLLPFKIQTDFTKLSFYGKKNFIRNFLSHTDDDPFAKLVTLSLLICIPGNTDNEVFFNILLEKKNKSSGDFFLSQTDLQSLKLDTAQAITRTMIDRRHGNLRDEALCELFTTILDFDKNTFKLLQNLTRYCHKKSSDSESGYVKQALNLIEMIYQREKLDATISKIIQQYNSTPSRYTSFTTPRVISYCREFLRTQVSNTTNEMANHRTQSSTP